MDAKAPSSSSPILSPPSSPFSLCSAEQLSQPLKPHHGGPPVTRGLIFFPKFLLKPLFYRNNSLTEKSSGTFSTTLCMCVCLCNCEYKCVCDRQWKGRDGRGPQGENEFICLCLSKCLFYQNSRDRLVMACIHSPALCTFSEFLLTTRLSQVSPCPGTLPRSPTLG